jgi:hypothetical protein
VIHSAQRGTVTLSPLASGSSISTRGLRLWFVRMNAITIALATKSGRTNTNRNGTKPTDTATTVQIATPAMVSATAIQNARPARKPRCLATQSW